MASEINSSAASEIKSSVASDIKFFICAFVAFGVSWKIFKRIKMKTFTEQQIDDIIKLKFGKLVTTPKFTSYVSNKVLGQLFGVSGSQIR